MRAETAQAALKTGQNRHNNPPSLEPPFMVGGFFHQPCSVRELHSSEMRVQADILDAGPDNREATGLRREDVDLISPLAHEAPEAFNGVRALNVSVPGLASTRKTECGCSSSSSRLRPASGERTAYLAWKAARWVNASDF